MRTNLWPSSIYDTQAGSRGFPVSDDEEEEEESASKDKVVKEENHLKQVVR